MPMRRVLAFCAALFLAPLLQAGEAGPLIPEAELRALDRVISREANRANADSQTLGDLVKLKGRLQRLQEDLKGGRLSAAAPDGTVGDAQKKLLSRLQGEAMAGGRAARRSLALYYIYLNEPEKALAEWRFMGRANDYDIPFLLLSSYLELALGEYTNGKRNLEQALRFMESRSALVLSRPLFCTNIAGFRLYDERPPGDAFLPGDVVLIYVEIEGAEFRALREGGSECRLMFGLKLQDDGQATRWAEPNFGEYSPAFAGPIRDLHAALTWQVPNDLEPGRYHLTVEAVEDFTKRRGESVVGFNVGRRDTNPERRPAPVVPPVGGFGGAGKTFPGLEPPDLRSGDYYQMYELLRRNEQNKKVE